jgi:hypothetical protein
MKHIAFAALLSLLATGAGAEPVKCVDAKGKVRYVDESMVGEEKCNPVKDAMNVVPPQDQPAAKSDNREGPRRQRREENSPRPRDDARVADAEAKLADAKSKLAEQEAIRLGGERNYSRVEERLQPYKEAVERAQKEVEQLRRDSR